MTPSSRRRATVWLCGSLVAAAAVALPARFRIEVRDDAVYGVPYEALAKAGLSGQPSSAGLSLQAGGAAVPVWVHDGGDGRFGPGDRIEFVGRHLAGAVTYRDPYSPWNVYVLDTEGEGAARMRAPAAVATPSPAAATLVARQHLERDVLLLRYSGPQERQEELWYWASISSDATTGSA